MATAPPSFPVSPQRRAIVAVQNPSEASRIRQGCPDLCPHLRTATDLEAILGEIEIEPCDVLLVDYGLLGPQPEEALVRLRRPPDPPIIIVIAPPGDPSPAYTLLEAGAHDVVHSPAHPLELRLRVGRLLEARDLGAHLASLEDAITERSRRSFKARTVVAHSAAMRKLQETLDRVARLRTTVLIRGESGVGKELVSRSLHFRSPRAQAPFVAINCAALPPHLIETELFGHERGAFTGAVSRRAGKFELAHSGTLFLDEIGETDVATQAKLLRVIETQEFMRVGGSRTLRVDVRLVAATNADLERMVREGRFREDLYYRLKVVTLEVPPLRQRREDIPELVTTTLEELCRTNHLRLRRITDKALDTLRRYPWPGNVRELINTLEAVVVSTAAETIDVEHLPAAIRGGLSPAVPLRDMAGRSLRDIEAEAIRATLSATGGSRTRAAEMLGISVRTLRRRIRELGLQQLMPPRPGRPRRSAPGSPEETKSPVE
ncbi:MAG: sigma-54 dependent transcriptional regulator [Acidobacteriota bacterium]|nr:sigma-54 dependent transcriptional regulator [Acidobacteriota bacterium]